MPSDKKFQARANRQSTEPSITDVGRNGHKHHALAQFPDMPADKGLKARAAATSKEPSITDIGMHRVAVKKTSKY